MTLNFGYKIFAQCDCFNTEITDNIIIHEDLEYAYEMGFEGEDNELRLDVYEPFGTDCSNPPLLLMFHGGGFLIGNENKQAVESFCESFAKRGYLTAAVGYRTCACANTEDFVKAVFRSLHDGKAAIRYMQKMKDEDVFKFNTDQVFVGGMSAGGFISLNLACLEEEEIPEDWVTYAQDVNALNPIEGYSFDPDYSSEVSGVINLAGALGFDHWLDEGDGPIISFHSQDDAVVPYNYYHPFEFLPGNIESNLPFVYGSYRIDSMAEVVNVVSEFHAYADNHHPPYQSMLGITDNERLHSIIDLSAAFLYPYIEKDTTFVSEETDLPDADYCGLFHKSICTTSLLCNETISTVCDTVNSTLLAGISSDLFLDLNGDEMIDALLTCQDFEILEANETINYQCCDTTILEVDEPTFIEGTPSVSTLQVYPNPVSDFFIIEIKNNNKSSISWKLYNQQGQQIQSAIISEYPIKIKRGEVATGIYFLQIKIGDSLTTHKLIFE